MQARGDRAAAAADRTLVDRAHPADLAAGADQEDLVGDVELGARDRALLDPDAEILRQLVGLNTNALDFRREQLYAERTQVNKQAASLWARVAAMPKHDGVPDAPVSVAEIAAELRAALATNEANASVARQAVRAAEQVGERRRKVEQLRQQLGILP